jgi:hypothetical protein
MWDAESLAFGLLAALGTRYDLVIAATNRVQRLGG